MTIIEQKLKLIEAELAFIRRQVGGIEGANGDDYARVDETVMAVGSIKEAVADIRLKLQPAS